MIPAPLKRRPPRHPARRALWRPVRRPLRRSGVLLAAFVLAGCQAGGGAGFVAPGRVAPPGAPPGTCWESVDTPAVIETVTEQVLVSPAAYNADGTLYRAAEYRTEVRQVIVEERRERWFQTPCPAEMTPDFLASVQRALAARGAYTGPITGRMDRATKSAIRAWQKARGTDSAALSLDTARELGLVAVARQADAS